MNNSSNADFGDAGELFRVVDQPEQLGPDERAGNDVAKGGAELELAEQGDKHQGGAKHDGAAFEDGGGCLGGLCGRGQPAASIAARSARNGRRMAP